LNFRPSLLASTRPDGEGGRRLKFRPRRFVPGLACVAGVERGRGRREREQRWKEWGLVFPTLSQFTSATQAILRTYNVKLLTNKKSLTYFYDNT